MDEGIITVLLQGKTCLCFCLHSTHYACCWYPAGFPCLKPTMQNHQAFCRDPEPCHVANGSLKPSGFRWNLGINLLWVEPVRCQARLQEYRQACSFHLGGRRLRHSPICKSNRLNCAAASLLPDLRSPHTRCWKCTRSMRNPEESLAYWQIGSAAMRPAKPKHEPIPSLKLRHL